MNKEGKRDELKGWLLALALAAILAWYVINPVPRPRHQTKLKDDLPGTDRHPEEARLGETSRGFGTRPSITPTVKPSLTADEDLPEWLEYIDLD